MLLRNIEMLLGEIRLKIVVGEIRSGTAVGESEDRHILPDNIVGKHCP